MSAVHTSDPELIERAVIGIARLTLDGRFVSANSALLRMLGYASLEELSGVTFSALFIDPAAHASLLRVLQADDVGKVTTWTFETAAPNGLRRIGFSSKGFFEVGKTYTVIGYPARDGSALAFVEQITLPDGRNVRIWFGDPNGSN